MSKYTATYFRHYILDLLNIQLFVTLISLPIFIAWGIPIPLSSILGNLIFSPFLTMHIFLSSLIFMGALFDISCTPLLWLLDKLSITWITLLTYFPTPLQVGFPALSMPALLAIAIITLLILHTKRYTREHKIIRYALLLFALICYAQLHKRLHAGHMQIPCFNGHVQVLTTPQQCLLIDTGAMGQRISAPSWAEYTLMPTLLKATGHSSITTFITLRPTSFTFAALELLCRKGVLRKIYVPVWEGERSRVLGGAFMAFIRVANAHGCTVVRFGYNQSHTVTDFSPKEIVTLTTTDVSHKKSGVRIAKGSVQGIIDNTPFSFYASSGQDTKKRTLSNPTRNAYHT